MQGGHSLYSLSGTAAECNERDNTLYSCRVIAAAHSDSAESASSARQPERLFRGASATHWVTRYEPGAAVEKVHCMHRAIPPLSLMACLINEAGTIC